MNSAAYPERTTGQNVLRQSAKAAMLLVLSLGLVWFSTNFPFFRIFEPQSMGWVLWVSYAQDLIQPFAFYFFICLGERWLKTWQPRALVAFAVPMLLELGQALYHPIGRYMGAFDPMDIVVYALGVALAVLIEQKVFAKFLKFW
jgi:hypothetical protein